MNIDVDKIESDYLAQIEYTNLNNQTYDMIHKINNNNINDLRKDLSMFLSKQFYSMELINYKIFNIYNQIQKLMPIDYMSLELN